MLPFNHHRLELKILHYCTPSASLVAQSVKNLPENARDPGAIPGLGRSPGEGNGNPPQNPCWKNLMDSGAWWAAVHGVAKSQGRLSD